MTIEDNLRVFSDYTVFDYKHGRCHLFALVLSEVFSKNITIFINEDPFFEDSDGEEVPPALEHAFCEVDSNFGIDANGIHEVETLFNEYCQDVDSTITFSNDVSKNIIIDWIENGMLIDFEPNEKECIKNFISINFKLKDMIDYVVQYS
jgi:hypothetical protein